MTKFLALALTLLSFQSIAAITVKDLNLSEKNNKGIVTIKYDGYLSEYPELEVNQNSVYIVIPDAKVKRVINKKVSFVTDGKNSRIHAAQFGKNSTRVKTILPFTINKVKDKVALTIRDNRIELSFPKLKAESAYLSLEDQKVEKVAKKSAPKAQVAKDLLNEDYLNSLINQEDEIKNEVKPAPVVAAKKVAPKAKEAKDTVKTTLAAPEKTITPKSKSSISLVEYGGKFVAFLVVVLALFYGVITLMKKGFIKRGKLGFLNNTDQVTVLSQTHIAPKKSLMLIKAHNQVFLVSNTESGIHPISEIKDVAGLIKGGEKIIAGNNFDDSLGNADTDENLNEKIKLKADITKSNKQSSLTDYLDVKDKVKFSDQLKKKVKSLKPLQ